MNQTKEEIVQRIEKLVGLQLKTDELIKKAEILEGRSEKLKRELEVGQKMEINVLEEMHKLVLDRLKVIEQDAKVRGHMDFDQELIIDEDSQMRVVRVINNDDMDNLKRMLSKGR